ncbi:MAG: hypothetical protein JSV83_03325 [Desulfobacterales bacterium]|nr:MAG: hypothetical protein JSV83_03325 [Desulfobacterales bacterium]
MKRLILPKVPANPQIAVVKAKACQETARGAFQEVGFIVINLKTAIWQHYPRLFKCSLLDGYRRQFRHLKHRLQRHGPGKKLRPKSLIHYRGTQRFFWKTTLLSAAVRSWATTHLMERKTPDEKLIGARPKAMCE